MNNKKSTFFVALVAAMMGSLITLMAGPFALVGRDVPVIDIGQKALVAAGQPEKTSAYPARIEITGQDTANIYKAVAKVAMPSVVGITTVATVKGNNPFFGTFSREMEGLGTGVIVDSRGYILTNSHVVENGSAREINIIFEDGSSEKGELLWNDSSVDLAIIKVEVQGRPLLAANLGDSDKLEVGDLAIAIGNPLGLEFERTMTEGIISGMNRKVTVEGQVMDSLIQTSAAINQGNSGGPLLNAKGEVIGINTVKAGGGEGLGFAIPINEAKAVVNSFIETGSFQKLRLGVQGKDLSEYTQITGFETSAKEGFIVGAVEPGSIAQKAGVKVYDVIIAIGDKKVAGINDLSKALFDFKKGEQSTLTVIRDGQEVTLSIQF